MWAAIFRFEIRYHLRQPLFYLVTFFLSVLLFVAGTGHGPGAAAGRLHLNAPAVILELLVKGIFLVLFLMTAFVASAALRDFDRRTSELFFSKPISRFDYLTGRFAGTMVVCALAYVVGAGALAASRFAPWIDPARVGPFRLAAFAFALGVLILPTLLALGAAIYALATWTRSTLATYAGIVAFFAASATAGLAASRLETRWIGELLDPFGVAALGGALRYWTVAELNTEIPPIGGALLWNRILWLVLGFAALGFAVAGFDPSRPRKRREPERGATETAAPVAATRRVRARTARRALSRRTVLVQLAHRVRRETAMLLGNFPFLGIVGFGLFVLVQAASSAGSLFGMPVQPSTHVMLEALRGGYSIVLLLVVVLYSGELVWKERTLGSDEVHDAMPVPSGVYLGGKLAALLLGIAVWLSVGILALACFQLASGYHDLEIGLYARGAVIAAVYPVLMMILSVFCHVVARSKLAGYGLVLLFLVGWDLLEELGFEHHLYRYASLPPTPWSDLDGYGPFLAPFLWYSLYWGFFALVLVGLSVVFWKRGTDDAWRVRRAEARARFRGPLAALTALGAAGFVATGCWIFYNTNVRNEYLPSREVAERRARYERLYRRYQGLDLPRIVAVRADVDLFPERRSLAIRGTYRLQNRSTGPLRDVHVSLPERVHLRRLVLPSHEVVLADDALGYRIYRLREPLAPDAEIELGFDLTVESRGFVNHGTETLVVANGSWFTKRDIFPVLGYDGHRQVEDPDSRRRQGLEPVLHLPEPDDLAALQRSPRAPDADRIDFETTVSTARDQIAVTSGELLREWVADGRRYFHYRAEVPVTHHFAYASARYVVTRSEWNPPDGSAQVVSIEVYHHPGHAANVARMIDATRKSLDYLTASLGPYPHRSLRIVEFPGTVRDGLSLPGLVALSESMGFNARLDGEAAIDFPFYVTAHEVAHQWWGQQLVGADVQGTAMLHETLAQYSALRVLERDLGRGAIRRVLGYERDWYLRGRARERGVEPPLSSVERQEYVYYHKGALAMYSLRDAVGAARLDGVLSRFFRRAAGAGPPYPASAELLDEIRAAVPEGSERLVDDLFERITLYENVVTAATSTARPDGTFLVRIDLEARKLQSDGAGAEREVPIDDPIDIAISGEGTGEAGDRPLLFLEPRRVQSSPAAFEIVVARRPAWVEIDPYSKLIDRHRDDNVRGVEPAAAPPPPD